jgi:RNA polymerase sigma factor (sigma-70 family)
MDGRTKHEELNRAQFDAARRAFFKFLRKRMSREFFERHGEDLFAQAAFEYSRQIDEGKEIRNPVAWINICGWHRAVSLLETRNWRPRMVSGESLAELPASSATPEEEVLGEDRFRKVHEAVEQLPAYQRKLLALCYFKDESVRAAARKLGWTPSKAQRAHEAAQRRLYELLGNETSDEL